MKIVFLFLSLLETGLGERRVCGLQMVVDNLVWSTTRQRVLVRHNLTDSTELEISRVTRSDKLSLGQIFILLTLLFRFEIKSLLSRLVNRANTVLLSQKFNNIHYRLAVQDIEVGPHHCRTTWKIK